jgi:hypothetical protein
MTGPKGAAMLGVKKRSASLPKVGVKYVEHGDSNTLSDLSYDICRAGKQFMRPNCFIYFSFNLTKMIYALFCSF